MAEEKKEQANERRHDPIQYYRSFIAAPKTQKQIVKSLGMTKLNQIVERPDNLRCAASSRKFRTC